MIQKFLHARKPLQHRGINSVPQLRLESIHLDKDRILKFRNNSEKQILEMKPIKSPKVDPEEEMAKQEVALNYPQRPSHSQVRDQKRKNQGFLFCFPKLNLEQ